MDGVRAFLGFAVCIWKWSVAKNLADDFPSAAFFVDAPRDLFHSLLGFDEGRAVAMSVWGGVDDGSQEEGVLEKTLDRFDEKRRQIPCVCQG